MKKAVLFLHFVAISFPAAGSNAGLQLKPEADARVIDGAPRSRLKDARDGQVYSIVRIGNARWFAENLKFKTADSRCYENDDVNCVDHGRWYRHADAMAACPAGWRLPSEVDWQALERALGMSESDIQKDRGRGSPLARRLKFGGDTGFNVKYSGWIDPYPQERFVEMGRSAAFWASTAGPPDELSATAWHRDVAANRNVIWRSPVNVAYWLSVRCVTGSNAR